MNSQNIYLVQVPGRKTLHIRDGKKRISTGETDRAAATAAMVEYLEKKSKDSGKKARKSAIKTETLGTVLDDWAAWKCVENPKSFEAKWRYLVARLKRRDSETPLVSLDHDWSREYVTQRLSEGNHPITTAVRFP